MDNLDLLYDIESNVLNKRKSWYYNKENICFLTGEQFRDFKYILEAFDNHKDYKDTIIILSKEKIHKNCNKIHRDNYGRLKYRPISFKHMFEDKFNGKDFNVDIVLDKVNNDYSVFKLNV